MLVSAKTDIGIKRSTNQDSFSYGQLDGGAITWAVVCDGMGGMAAGNVASATAVEVISGSFENNLSPKSSASAIRNLLKSSIESANARVYNLAMEEDEYRGMGTTVVGVIAVKDVLHVIHVGDSRCYLKNTAGIKQITTDHSFVQQLVERGAITPEEARVHPQRNLITRVVGVHEDVECDYACFHNVCIV